MKQWCVFLGVALVTWSVVAADNDFFDAVRGGDGDKVKALLQTDPKLVEARTEDGSTGLHLAALEGHAQIAGLLLANGAEVNAHGLRQETPLHMAVYGAHREVVEVLLANKADVNAQNTEGSTPLHIAARKGHREVGALLLDHGANIDARDKQDLTPLHAAAGAGHKEVVALLLSRGADMLAKDKSGRTAKALAAEHQHEQVVEVLTPRVGDFYTLGRLEFEGVQAFTAAALRQGLKDAPGFADGTHPLAPLDELLQAIQRKLTVGYQHHGFAEVRVIVQHEPKAGRIVAKVVEGPRYLCEEVKVTGATNAAVADIVQPLTVSRPVAASLLQPFVFKDTAPGVNPLDPSPPDESKPQEAPWIKGEGAPCSEADARRMREQVIDALHEQGFLLAKADVRVEPDIAHHTAQLQVRIESEGPRAVVERIDVAGTRKSSTASLLRYLELKPGTELSSKVLAKVQDRLWRAARFLTNNLSLSLADNAGRVVLRVEVAEYEAAPPLDQQFTREEQAMLRLREWLAKINESGDELAVTALLPSGQVDVVVSPRQGLLALLRAPEKAGPGEEEYALDFQPGRAGFYAPVSKRKLVLPAPEAQLQVTVKFEASSRSTDTQPFSLTALAGFQSAQADLPNRPPYRFELALEPVACISVVHREKCAAWFDGDILVRSNATMLLQVDARTGRLVELRYADAEEGQTITLKCRPKAFAAGLQRLEEVTDSLPNVALTNAPLSSAAAFLVEEALSSKRLEPYLETNTAVWKYARVAVLARSFPLERILAPLNRLWDTNSSATTHPGQFVVPTDPDYLPRSTASMITVIADWILRKSDDAVPTHSWPWTLLREACFVVQGRSRYTEQALQEALDSADTGPLGCLALAEVLGRFMPQLEREAASRGLERLTPAEARRDLRLLLTGNSVLSECCQAAAAALRNVSASQLEMVLKNQPAATAALLRDCLRRLQADTNQPVFEALAPALDTWWEPGLKRQVAEALQAHLVDAAQAFRDGAKTYRDGNGNKAEAAKLFRQAAERGHPAAQYFLGMMYEKGEAFSRDLPLAVAYYTQSATNGYEEAAMTLANLYNDGIGVKQDCAEAYVWFSVAAARRHPLAEVFRNSAQRKLSPEELAKAQKRAAVLLQSMPSAPDAAGPSRR